MAGHAHQGGAVVAPVLHELAGQLDRIPLDAGDARDAEVVFLAVGSAGMAQAPTTGSTQNAFLINFNGTIKAGTLLHVQNSQGEDLLTFAPAKQIQSIVFSSPDIELGETYTVFTGGSSSGTLTAGLYLEGTYTPGTEIGSFTQSNVITTLGSSGGRTRP